MSYVNENRAVAERLAADLTDAGVDVWLDREQLAPGERWREVIRKSISTARMFIACFSREYAIRDQSEMNEELTLAIEELRRRPADQAWFIPVVIDDSEVPNRDIGAGSTLRNLHRVNLAANWAEGVANIAKVALREPFDKAHPSFPDIDVKAVRVSAERQPSDAASPGMSAASEPDLRLSYSLARGYTRWDQDEIRIILLVTNHARASALAPCIRLQVPQSFAIGGLGVSSRQPGALFRVIAETAQPPAATFIAANFVIHSALPVEFAQVTTIVKRNMPVPWCDIRFHTAASNLITGEGTLRIEAAEIAQMLERSIDTREL